MVTRLDTSDIPRTEWKQERPDWCKYQDCQFKRRVQDAFCCGDLPEPAPHNGDFNDYRICFCGSEKYRLDGFSGETYQVNDTDLEYLRWIFDALDGKKTSWISRIKDNE